MASPDESIFDWVQLNYQNVENKRIPPITWKIPKKIKEQWERERRQQQLGYAVVMMSTLRRKFYDRTNRPKRNS